jgi:hypothetical protein
MRAGRRRGLTFVIARSAKRDEAIRAARVALDCFAPLAMTERSGNVRSVKIALPSRFILPDTAAQQFVKGSIMAVDGTWNLTMDTPMGERASTLVVKVSGGKLEGTQSAEGQTAQIFEGRVNGNDVGWKVSITQPMPLTLDFSGTVEGDAITGSVQLGMFGSSPFRAKRG